MLISCPKCHSIYEIPNDLIGKTGKRFRCQTCATIWHAMPEDALDKDDEDEPYIEAMPIAVPPYRNYPADRINYTIPADSKSGVRTRSSQQIIEEESNARLSSPLPSSKKKKEITLTSDHGTSFTINTIPDYEEDSEDKKAPHFSVKEEGVHADKTKRLLPEGPFKGYKKRTCFIILLMITLLFIFLRREIVFIYPEAEIWYNKVQLSGLQNPQYLKFEQVKLTKENENSLKITADIVNHSHYNTYIPSITLNNSDEEYLAEQNFIKAGEKTHFETVISLPENSDSISITLSFKKL